MNKFNIGDKVVFNNDLYKIIYIYDDGMVKLRSVRGKVNCIYYRIHPDYLQKEDD